MYKDIVSFNYFQLGDNCLLSAAEAAEGILHPQWGLALLLLLLLLPLLLLLLLQQGALGVAQDNSGPFFGFIGFSGGECAAMKRRRSIIKCIKRRKETKGDRQRQIYNAKEKRQEEADK